MANRHRVDSEIYKVGIPNQKFLSHRTKKICFLEKYLNFYPAKVCQLHFCAVEEVGLDFGAWVLRGQIEC